MKPAYKPWGGGSVTINMLREALTELGYVVVFNLNNNDIDVLFIMDPRTWCDPFDEIIKYSKINKAKIVHRVGDIGLHGKPELTNLLKKSIVEADYVTYISKFAKKYLSIDHPNSNVIELAPSKIFFSNRKENLNLSYPIKIVTHHWSTNILKGFDYYKKLDSFLLNNKNIEFTFIGRLPDGFSFDNSIYISPLGKKSLSKILPKYDIYLSASKWETGGNHVLEAIGAGLPILFHEDGGGINDYCYEYGLSYNSFNDMIKKIDELIEKYHQIKSKILRYDRTLESVIYDYVHIIKSL